MSWTYDVDTQSLYVRVSTRETAGQIEMPDGTVVDIDDAGQVVGVEVIRASAPWDLEAVAERFNLSSDAVEQVRWVTETISRFGRPTDPDEVGVLREVPTSRTNSLPELIDA